MGLSLGVLRVFADHTRKRKRKANALTIFALLRLLAYDGFYAQPAVHAINLRTWWTTIIFITGKTRRPLNWALCRDQDDAGSGISFLYIYLWLVQIYFKVQKYFFTSLTLQIKRVCTIVCAHNFSKSLGFLVHSAVWRKRTKNAKTFDLVHGRIWNFIWGCVLIFLSLGCNFLMWYELNNNFTRE